MNERYSDICRYCTKAIKLLEKKGVNTQDMQEDIYKAINRADTCCYGHSGTIEAQLDILRMCIYLKEETSKTEIAIAL